MFIRFPIGIIIEAVLLARRKNRMRVAIAGFEDAIELRRSGARWFTAAAQPVEFDFLMSGAHQSESVPASTPARAARAAG
ncbi:MAG: hypothetical protein ABSH56_34830 [Bryobacteraceae bacterium]